MGKKYKDSDILAASEMMINEDSVVYGANAAGKSNIVSAIQTFKSIIIHGNIFWVFIERHLKNFYSK